MNDNLPVNYKHRDKLKEKHVQCRVTSKYKRYRNLLFVLKIILAISLCTMVVSGCTATNKEDKTSNDKQSASPSKEEIFLLYSDNKYGFMNLTGQIVIETQFDYVSNFHEGIAIAGTKEKKYGFINVT